MTNRIDSELRRLREDDAQEVARKRIADDQMFKVASTIAAAVQKELGASEASRGLSVEIQRSPRDPRYFRPVILDYDPAPRIQGLGYRAKIVRPTSVIVYSEDWWQNGNRYGSIHNTDFELAPESLSRLIFDISNEAAKYLHNKDRYLASEWLEAKREYDKRKADELPGDIAFGLILGIPLFFLIGVPVLLILAWIVMRLFG